MRDERSVRWKDGERAYSVAVPIDELFSNHPHSVVAAKPKAENVIDGKLKGRVIAAHINQGANAVLLFVATLDDARLLKSELKSNGIRCGKNISSGVMRGGQVIMDDVETMKMYNQS